MSATAQALHNEGMTRAADHAEREHANWRAKALTALADFITQDMFLGPFTAEDLRLWAKLPEPPDRRAWGAVVMQAAREGWIVKVGYRPHKDPSRHRGISTVWEKRL